MDALGFAVGFGGLSMINLRSVALGQEWTPLGPERPRTRNHVYRVRRDQATCAVMRSSTPTVAPEEYASKEFHRYCNDKHVRPTSNAPACGDNAAAESFFASLKNEMYYCQRFATGARARFAVADLHRSARSAHGIPNRSNRYMINNRGTVQNY